ncbi:MAG: hypothetical protein P1U57_11870, partial [Oleibacter sp.]|nr:hypothetical protein [Thalassolituus sp.]
GKHASRNMTLAEAEFTMTQFLSGNARPEQIGAVFMLLRVLEETSEELAGFAKAINKHWPEGSARYDLVWASYAGKRRQPMWWALSAKLLTDMGYKILVHGTLSHTQGRIYAHEVFEALGWPSLSREQVSSSDAPLAYLPCAEIHPLLQEWLGLKSVLGVRSPINTVLKTIAPDGVASVQGIFHPNYRPLHLGAAALNGDIAMVIKGEGGEFEVNPERKCVAGFEWPSSAYSHQHPGNDDEVEEVEHVAASNELKAQNTITIANTQSHYDDKTDDISPESLKAFWLGESESEYAQSAVLNTAALALCAMRRSNEFEQAFADCTQAWLQRDKSAL